MKTENNHEAVKRICTFLANYTTALLGCGASCIRAKRNVNRMAEALGVTTNMIMLPNNVDISVWDSDHRHSYHQTVAINHRHNSFSINTQLSSLSWKIYEKQITFSEAEVEFERIVATRAINKWLVMLLVAAANASFCRLFGGDFVSMGIVAFATLVGYYLKIILLDARFDTRATFMCCSFLSAVIGTAGYVFSLGTPPEIALGTSVLYLIPGIPYINSVSDMIEGFHLHAFSRFVGALILTACIAIGMTGAFYIMNITLF